MVLRRRRPDMPRPFRMWLYPVPAVLAFLGFVYVIVMRPKSLESIRLAMLVVIVGTAAVPGARRRFARRPMTSGLIQRVDDRVVERRADRRGSDCCRASGGRGWSAARLQVRSQSIQSDVPVKPV